MIEDPKIHIKVPKDEYYENELILGTLKIDYNRHYKDFIVRLAVIYEESFVLFNEKTE